MRRTNFIIIFIFFGFQKYDTPIRVIDIYDIAKKISSYYEHDNLEMLDRSILCKDTFSDFDFSNMIPLKQGNYENFVEVGYDSTGNILEMLYQDIGENDLGSFKLYFFNHLDFIIIPVEIWSINYEVNKMSPYGFLPGFFLHDKRLKQNYFVNVSSLELDYFDKFYPFIQNDRFIASITLIDSDFYPSHIFRFSFKGKLSYFSEILYESNSKSLKFEQLYFYDTDTPEDFFIDEQTTFQDFFGILNKYKDIDRKINLLPCIKPASAHIPLWHFAGAHEFCP